MTTRQSVRIAGFFFATAAALTAQSPVNTAAPAKVDLIAFNTSKVVPRPLAAAPITTFEPKPAASETAVPVQSAEPQATGSVRNLILLPAGPMVALIPEPASKGDSRFTAGPGAFSDLARMDPAFGLPVGKSGAGPAAVKFAFGRK
jgi:hypothetical protein